MAVCKAMAMQPDIHVNEGIMGLMGAVDLT